MGIWEDIITIAGLAFIFIYQKQKISALETQIKSQTGILERAETFVNLFDSEKLKGYAEIREEKVKVEMEIEIKKIKGELDERMKKEKDFEEKAKLITREFFIILDAFYDAFFLLPSIKRKTVILRIGEGKFNLKTIMERADRELDRIENSEKRGALISALISGEGNKVGG